MFKPVSCESLSKTNLDKLKTNSIRYYQDIINSKSSWTREIYEEIERQKPVFTIKSALDLWQEETTREAICEIPGAPGAGLRAGEVLEICGGPGQGKTQLCLQQCVGISQSGNEAIFIDTEANFSSDRVREMALVSGAQEPDQVLKRIHFLEVFGVDQLCAAINLLKEFLKQHPKVRLIVIDGIAAPFKDNITTELERTALLYRSVAELRRLGLQQGLGTLVTNEVSVRVGLGVVAALGDSWAHLPNRRVLLQPPLVAVTHGDPELIVTSVQHVPECTYFQYRPGERPPFRIETLLEMALAVFGDQI